MVKVTKLNEDSIVPTKGSMWAGAYDLYSTEDILILPGMSEVIGTGVALEIDRGWLGVLTHRSSMAFKLDCVSSLGYIDSDYRGELKVKIFNHGIDGVHLKKGDRFAQIAFVPHYAGDLVEVDSLSETIRGAGGFGSTGR